MGQGQTACGGSAVCVCACSYREARREVGGLAELLAGGEEAAVLVEESTATVALVIGRMGGTSSTTGSAVTNEEHAWLGFWVVWAESLLVEIFAGEVKCLGWEITDNVSKIASPERCETLFLDNSTEAITDTVISLINGDVLVSILNLKNKLHSFNWGDNCLGNSC